MDKEQLLSAEVQKFIKEHESDDLRTLMLQREKYSHLPLADIVDQIKARLKAKSKLPTWYQTNGILFPHPVSVEQSSSETTARWKASYIGAGTTGADLTGGFGIDSHFFSRVFKSWTHVEPNKTLQEVVAHNCGCLGDNNISFSNLTSEKFLSTRVGPYDFIYIDPDRRPSNERVWDFKESLPQINKSLIGKLRQVSARLLIKASPMIDIKAALEDLENVNEVIIVGVNNEVKEVLFYLNFKTNADLQIRCVNIKNKVEDVFIFNHSDSKQEVIEISEAKKYLLEPNASIMKSGGQDILARQHKLSKLHRNTNLYTSNALPDKYPGRVFEIIANIPYKKKDIAKLLPKGKVNLSTRNFVDTPDKMRKKLGLRDGGDKYLFGYRDHENSNKIVICHKPENK